jgi:hypothetical protein
MGEDGRPSRGIQREDGLWAGKRRAERRPRAMEEGIGHGVGRGVKRSLKEGGRAGKSKAVRSVAERLGQRR